MYRNTDKCTGTRHDDTYAKNLVDVEALVMLQQCIDSIV